MPGGRNRISAIFQLPGSCWQARELGIVHATLRQRFVNAPIMAKASSNWIGHVFPFGLLALDLGQQQLAPSPRRCETLPARSLRRQTFAVLR